MLFSGFMSGMFQAGRQDSGRTIGFLFRMTSIFVIFKLVTSGWILLSVIKVFSVSYLKTLIDENIGED